MEERVKENLESYLSGSQPPGKDPMFNRILANPAAGAELRAMKAQAQSIRDAYRLPTDVCPAPGFYARVMALVEAEQSRQSLWSIFLEPFGRRLVYAAATLLLLMAVAIYSNEREVEIAETPANMLVDDHPQVHLVGNNPAEDRGRVFVTLTALDQ